MQRVKNDQDWTFFCLDEAYDVETEKGLIDLRGEEFEALYTRLEAKGKDRRTVKAQQLWFRELEPQMELEGDRDVVWAERWSTPLRS